jgi:hypothetical protein
MDYAHVFASGVPNCGMAEMRQFARQSGGKVLPKAAKFGHALKCCARCRSVA